MCARGIDKYGARSKVKNINFNRQKLKKICKNGNFLGETSVIYRAQLPAVNLILIQNACGTLHPGMVRYSNTIEYRDIIVRDAFKKVECAMGTLKYPRALQARKIVIF